MGQVDDDDTRRIHKRINDLSVGLMVVSLGLICVALSVICLSLDDIFHELGRIF